MGARPGALARFADWARRVMAADAALYVEFLDSGIYCEPKHVKKALRLIGWTDPSQSSSIKRLSEALCMEFRGRPGAREAFEREAPRLFVSMRPDRREAWREELARACPRPQEWAGMLMAALGPAAAAAEAREIEASARRPAAAPGARRPSQRL